MRFTDNFARSRTGYFKILTVRAKPECKNVVKSEKLYDDTRYALL